MKYEHEKSKDSNLEIEKEISVTIHHFKITGNSLSLNTEIKNRDEIAQEVEFIIRHANERELSRAVAFQLCLAILTTMIKESSAPDSFEPLDLINEYLDVIFGERIEVDSHEVGTKRDDNK